MLKTLYLALPIFFVACDDEDEPPPSVAEQDLVEVAQNRSELSTLVELLETADLSSTLAGPGPFTLFAPTNAAFEKLPPSQLSALMSDTAALSAVLTNHVVSGQLEAATLVTQTEATALNGDTIRIRVEGSTVILTDEGARDSRVIETDLAASNGVIHLIDTVLVPAELQARQDIVEVATGAGLDTLVAAVTTAGLAETLSTGGPFTVFAPTDEAFAALGSAVPSDPDLLANVLLHHVVPGLLDSSAVLARDSLTTAANTTLDIDASSDPITVGGAELSSTLDVEAENGIVHVMNEVIVPPTILETAAATPQLSTLVTAVGSASPTLQGALSNGGPITVFAPVNSAFAAIPEADLEALLADQQELDRVLGYHVVMGQTLSGELEDGQTIGTASGETLTVDVEGEEIRLIDGLGSSVRVVTADIRLLDGVVHLIDGVLLPPGFVPGAGSM